MILGIDEAGRGALAGPVVVAGVIFPKTFKSSIFKDSKTLSILRRDYLFDHHIKQKIKYWISVVSPQTIDTLNILNATLLGMQRVIIRCSQEPTKILIDGNRCPSINMTTKMESIVKGDSKIPEISCASIIAKVVRDRIMKQAAIKYQQFNFGRHFGYATLNHYNEIEQNGSLSMFHRQSFKLFKEKPLFHV